MSFNPAVAFSSIYLHWPFCPYKCHFCPFVAIASHDQYMERYHKALKKEIHRFMEQRQERPLLKTIYLGGGTPSTYPNELLLDMFGILKERALFDQDIEITIEVNPGTVDQAKLYRWKEAGINRLSIGVQSFNDKVLASLNRHQSLDDVFNLLQYGSTIFDNISIDLILGLPGVSAQEWQQLIKQVVLLPIQHISIYFLTVHEGTQLYFRVKKKEVVLHCDDEIVDLYYWTVSYLTAHGFKQYELSNFAKEDRESNHNKMYWERKPFKAFGLGACEFDGAQRFQNEKNLFKYMDALERDESVTIFSEKLTDGQIYLERLMLGLRQTKGVPYEDLLQNLTEQEQKEIRERIAVLKQHGFIKQWDEKVALTARGLAVENDIVVRLSL